MSSLNSSFSGPGPSLHHALAMSVDALLVGFGQANVGVTNEVLDTESLKLRVGGQVALPTCFSTSRSATFRCATSAFESD